MTSKELMAAKDAINRMVAEANKWQERIEYLQEKADAAEDAGDAAQVAKYERWQERAMQSRDKSYTEAHGAAAMLSAVGYVVYFDDYSGGGHFPAVDLIL